MSVLFANNATAKLASTVAIGATSFTVVTGDGARFPEPANLTESFYVRLGGDDSNEVVRCSQRTADIFTCAPLTQAWNADTSVMLTVNAQVLSRFPQIIDTDITIDVSDLETNNPDFYSIEDALAALSHVFITDSALVTIRVRGSLEVTQALSDAKLLSPHRIYFEGNFDGFKQITSIASSSGSAGAWSVVLNVTSAAGTAIGDYLYINNPSGGTNASALIGCHRVTATGATTITVASKHKTAAPSGAVTAEARLIKNVIRCNNCNGIEFSNGGFAGFLDVVFEFSGAGDYAGFSLRYGSSDTFRYGGNAHIGYGNAAMFCGITNFTYGVDVGNNASFQYAQWGLMLSGCAMGIVIDGAGGLTSAIITGCETGIKVNGGRAHASDLAVYGCTTGVSVVRSGGLRLTDDAAISQCATGLYAAKYGYIAAPNVTFDANTTDANPVIDTVGNVGGYIDTVA